jgi:hypothetical protein
LKQLDKTDEADSYAKEASKTRRIFLQRYSDQLNDDPDEDVVFDQMVSPWAGRFTGKLRDGAPSAAKNSWRASMLDVVKAVFFS